MNVERLQTLPAVFRFWLVLIFFGFATMAIIIFLAYRKLEYMENLLNKCSIVGTAKKIAGNSFDHRMHRMMAVLATLVFVKLNVRRGVTDPDQIKNFPRGLKILIRGCWLSLTTITFAAFPYGIFFKQ